MYDDLRVKAMVEGLDVNFEDILELDGFVDVIKELIKENPYTDCDVVGDCDGLLISDKNDELVLTVIFSLEKIKFLSFIATESIEKHQAEIIARSVLACIGGLLVWYGDKYLQTPPRELKKLTEAQLQRTRAAKPGDTFKFEFVNDGFGLY
jgi:hypothetical protein